jgi:hypothetical protein
VSTTKRTAPTDFLAVCRGEHDAAFQLLAAGDTGHLLPRLCAHVNAATEVLSRAAIGAAAADPARCYLRTNRDLMRVTWALDRRSTGDLRTSGLALTDLRETLEIALLRHVAAEVALVTAAVDAGIPVSPDRYLVARERAPRRPHPYLAGHRRIAHRLFLPGGLADRVRDLMDGRSLQPRPVAAPRPPSRWGTYVTGVQDFPVTDVDRRTDRGTG